MEFEEDGLKIGKNTPLCTNSRFGLTAVDAKCGQGSFKAQLRRDASGVINYQSLDNSANAPAEAHRSDGVRLLLSGYHL